MTATSSITIRRGITTDLAEVQRLNHALYEYEQALNAYRDSYELNWTYIDAGTKYFSGYLSGLPTSIIYIAEYKGRPIGYIAGSYRSHAARSQNPVAEIENMFVEETYRRQNAGHLLLEAFRAWAKSNSAARLRVAAFTKNLPAIAFYRNFGFEDLELYMEVAI